MNFCEFVNFQPSSDDVRAYDEASWLRSVLAALKGDKWPDRDAYDQIRLQMCRGVAHAG